MSLKKGSWKTGTLIKIHSRFFPERHLQLQADTEITKLGQRDEEM